MLHYVFQHSLHPTSIFTPYLGLRVMRGSGLMGWPGSSLKLKQRTIMASRSVAPLRPYGMIPVPHT